MDAAVSLVNIDALETRRCAALSRGLCDRYCETRGFCQCELSLEGVRQYCARPRR